MSLEQEGLSGPNQAWTLYMAGSSFDQIAEVLDIDPEDVPDLLRVVVEQLAEARGTSPAQLDLNAELDLERVNELFQTVYAKALMTNEPEHQKFALQLMSFRRRLQAKVAHVPIPDPETAPSHKQVRAAWQILAGGAPVVAQALVDIAANGDRKSVV